MSFIYTVLDSEDMTTIARKNGFRDWRTIYDDPSNAELRERRPNPNLLFPGDLVNIPDRVQAIEPAATGQRHTFFVSTGTRVLDLKFKDHFNRPITDTPFEIIIGGVKITTSRAKTGHDGSIREDIPATTLQCTVRVGEYSWDLTVAALNPIAKTVDNGTSGAQERLRNLGYLSGGHVDGLRGSRTGDAIRQFQRDQRLAVTGHLDPATLTALVAVHGC